VRPEKLHALTSLRFFAALAIVMHHCRELFLPPSALLDWPLGQGVSFFFVLSGFILAYVYPELKTTRAVLEFWKARIARVWPVHAACLFLLILLAPQFRVWNPGPFLLNCFLLHSWAPWPDLFFSFNGPSWSVSTELGFYALFPVMIKGFCRNWWKVLTAAAVLLVCLMVACEVFELPAFDIKTNTISTLSLLYISPLGRLFEFVVGMCSAVLWTSFRPRMGSNLWWWTMAELSSVVLVFWVARYGTQHLILMAVAGPLPVAAVWLMHAGAFMSFAVLIVTFASGSGLLGRLLSTSPLVFLGEISYSMYMLHQVLIWGYVSNFGWTAPATQTPTALVCFLSVVLISSAALHLSIERTCRNMLTQSFALRSSASN